MREWSTEDDDAVIAGFGREWRTFAHDGIAGESDLRNAFEAYFRIFPWETIPPAAVGADVGCGTGRWASFVAPRVGRLYCVDPSTALDVARRKLAAAGNCEFVQSRADAMPIPDASLDFAYCLGVLHHVSNTQESLNAIVRKLRPNAPLLLYLYYALENRPAWYRALWHLADVARRIVSRTPFAMRVLFSSVVAAVVYWPLARLARLVKDSEAIPLASYRSMRFYFMRADALDRFGTRLEKRFTRAEIAAMMQRAGLERIEFSESPPFWVALGRRSSS